MDMLHRRYIIAAIFCILREKNTILNEPNNTNWNLQNVMVLHFKIVLYENLNIYMYT